MNISEVSNFKKNEIEYELRHESPNNYAVYINDKQWKVVSSRTRAERMAATLKSKGKNATVHMTGTPVSEGSKPQKKKPYQPNKNQPNPVAKNSRNKPGAGAHKSQKDYDRRKQRADIQSRMDEGPLVVSRSSDLMGMLDVLLKDFKSKRPSDEEMKALLKSLGYNMTKDGERTTLVKEDADENPELTIMISAFQTACMEHYRYAGEPDRKAVEDYLAKGNIEDAADEMAGAMADSSGGSEMFDQIYDLAVETIENSNLSEGNGNIRKIFGAGAMIAMLAGLWGVNDNMAQKAYNQSGQLKQLTAFLQIATNLKDEDAIADFKQRIANHKTRLDLGKGEVMGKDGKPIKVVYNKDAN